MFTVLQFKEYLDDYLDNIVYCNNNFQLLSHLHIWPRWSVPPTVVLLLQLLNQVVHKALITYRYILSDRWLLKSFWFCISSVVNKLLTWATPSSQPRITSWCPILNLNGLPRDLDESNTFPSGSVPDRKPRERAAGERAEPGLVGQPCWGNYILALTRLALA